MRGQIREALRWLGPQAILSLFSTCSPLSVEEAARSSQIGCTPPPSPKGSQGTRRPLRTTRIGELSATVNRPDQVGSGGASSTTTRSGRVGPGAGTARLPVRAGPGAVDAGTPPSLGQAGRPADGPGITYCVNPSRTRGRAVPVLHAGLRSSLGRLSPSRRQWVFADGAAVSRLRDNRLPVADPVNGRRLSPSRPPSVGVRCWRCAGRQSAGPETTSDPTRTPSVGVHCWRCAGRQSAGPETTSDPTWTPSVGVHCWRCAGRQSAGSDTTSDPTGTPS
jgi:hypothetical protein